MKDIQTQDIAIMKMCPLKNIDTSMNVLRSMKHIKANCQSEIILFLIICCCLFFEVNPVPFLLSLICVPFFSGEVIAPTVKSPALSKSKEPQCLDHHHTHLPSPNSVWSPHRIDCVRMTCYCVYYDYVSQCQFFTQSRLCKKDLLLRLL